MMEAPSQFIRSAIPSNGDADACTPLSPTFGAAARPSASHSARIAPRIDAGGACAGSVGPRTTARKSAHESSVGSHSTE